MAKKDQQTWKPLYTWLIIIAFVIMIIGSVVGTYNSLVREDVAVDGAFADIETQYQRRADLIPNLVSTVKGFANQELTVLTEVTEARSAWAQAKSSGTDQQVIAAANNMDSALSRLLVTVEAYPELKSDQNFLALQDELAGTENRISVARIRYNEVVKTYNTHIRRFPANIIANWFGFESAEFFESQPGSEVAPEVVF